MQIQDLRNDVLSKLDEVIAAERDQMVVNWVLQGQREAYEHMRDTLNKMFDEWKGETLKDMTDEDIMKKGREVVECYAIKCTDNGVKCYGESAAINIFMDGAKWILGQLKA